jgi:hypothetical protein
VINPQEIRSKTERKYTAFLKAWLKGENLFPLRIPGKMASSGTEWATLRRWMTSLVAEAKPQKKYSYAIEFALPVQTRSHGVQTLPRAIWIEDESDFLHYLGKSAEFAQFQADVARIRDAFPLLEDWVGSKPKLLIKYAGQWPELLKVCQYFAENPQPGMYIRELPVAVHSKFVEQHKGILGELLKIILPPSAVSPQAPDFEGCFGLCKPPLTFRLRLLDPALQEQLRFPATDLSMPLADLAQLTLPDVQVIVSENLMPFLTLPPVSRGIAIFGEGNAVAGLQAPWLTETPILYWGDLDIQGFRFLAKIRLRYPQTQSLFMDLATLEKYQTFAVPGVQDGQAPPQGLTPEEALVYQKLETENLRLEQERILQAEVVERLREIE